MTRRAALFFVLFLPLSAPVRGETQEQFLAALNSIPYEDRISHIETVLSGDPSHAVAGAAVQALVVAAEELGRHDEALETINSYLLRTAIGSKPHQEAFHVRARLLYGAGRKDESMAAFDEGASRGWVPEARQVSRDKTLNALDPVAFAIQIFNDGLNDPHVYAKRNNYLKILCIERLWPKRQFDPEFSATAEILPNLVNSRAHPIHLEVAEAVCLIVDARYDEAVTVLRESEARLPPQVPLEQLTTPETLFAHNESYNISLYVAAARLLQGGEHIAAGRDALEEFWSLNSKRSKHAGQMMRIASALELGPSAHHDRVMEVTSFLIGKGFTTKPEFRSQNTSNFLRHVTSMHMFAHIRRKDWDSAERTAMELLSEYDPSNVSCNNALRMLAFIHCEQMQWDEAEEPLNRLLKETHDHKWKRVAKSQLARVGMFQGKPSQSIELLLEGLDSAPPSERRNYYYEAIEQYAVDYRELGR